jgi:hypothetical protein
MNEMASDFENMRKTRLKIKNFFYYGFIFIIHFKNEIYFIIKNVWNKLKFILNFREEAKR